MDDVSAALRAAVAEPPPTTIDLDRLIANEGRRSRTRAWASAGTGLAAAVTAVVVVPVLLAGSTPDGGASPDMTFPAFVDTPGPPMPCTPTVTPSPSGGPPGPLPGTVRPRPTEPPDQAIVRLTAALLEALRAALPANVSIEDVLPGCPLRGFESTQGGVYGMGMRVVRGEDSGLLYVWVSPTVPDRVGCTSTDDGERCDRVDLADGTVVATRERAVGQIAAEVARSDGTSVMLVDNYWMSREAPGKILTAEQVITIGEDPSLTLYP